MTRKSAAAKAAPAPQKAPRFERLAKNGDVVLRGGVLVRDTSTGLIWTRGNASDELLTWEEAKASCEALKLGGHSDWRLPTRAELLSLVDDTRFDPAIDPVFECEPSWYWTSTAYAPSPGDCAWGVDFSDGSANCGDRDGHGFVRAVRASQ